MGKRAQARSTSTVLKMLTDACDAMVAVKVLSTQQGGVLRCRFERLAQEVIALEILDEDSVPSPSPASLIGATFVMHERHHVFLARVRGVTRRRGLARIELDHPDQIASAEARATFRIPVAEGAPLTVRVSDCGAPPKVRDISAGGIRLDFAETADPPWKLGEVVSLQLQDGQAAFEVPARVVWSLDSIYGLNFSGRIGEQRNGDALRSLLLDLERLWLQQRAAAA